MGGLSIEVSPQFQLGQRWGGGGYGRGAVGEVGGETKGLERNWALGGTLSPGTGTLMIKGVKEGL